ncbi:MAG: AAA family ATPase [Aquabacterium sp.]|nr:MAG: AAA family ATPase [Aquabacterium sp.]
MYLDHFGLAEAPFGLTPDPDFLFLDGQHEAALQTLLVALDGGEGFVKVTGEVGTGKTLLCRRLLDAFGPDVVTAYLLNPRLKPAALLRALACELGLQLEGKLDEHALYRVLESELLRLAGLGKRVVCCIDEAQALPPASLEALRLLSNLETRKRKLVQVALFGQPELDEMLASPALRSLASRMGFGARLQGMGRASFQRYLQHRLIVAGWKGHIVFSTSATWLLWHASGGVPRTANLLAHQCLMLAFGRGAHAVGWTDAWEVCRERAQMLRSDSLLKRPIEVHS